MVRARFDEGQYDYEYAQIGKSFLGIPSWRAKIRIHGTALSATKFFTCSEKRVRNHIAKEIKRRRKEDWFARNGKKVSR